MAKSKSASVQARVLLDLAIDGVPYRLDQVIEVDPAVIDAYPNQLDAHPEAVAYAISLGATPVVHAPAVAAAQE